MCRLLHKPTQNSQITNPKSGVLILSTLHHPTWGKLKFGGTNRNPRSCVKSTIHYTSESPQLSYHIRLALSFIKATKHRIAASLLQWTWKIHIQRALTVKQKKKIKQSLFLTTYEAFPKCLEKITDNFWIIKTNMRRAKQKNEGKELHCINLAFFKGDLCATTKTAW